LSSNKTAVNLVIRFKYNFQKKYENVLKLDEYSSALFMRLYETFSKILKLMKLTNDHESYCNSFLSGLSITRAFAHVIK